MIIKCNNNNANVLRHMQTTIHVARCMYMAIGRQFKQQTFNVILV